MQIFTDTNFKFMERKYYGLVFSGVLVIVAIVAMIVVGFNFGIDFRGGTEVEFKFAEKPSMVDLRTKLESSPGLEDVSLQSVGDPTENTVLVRARGGAEEEGSGVSTTILQALYTPEENAARNAGRININQVGEEDLRNLIAACPDLGGADPGALAAGVLALRKNAGVIRSYDELASVEGFTPETLACVQAGTFRTDFALWKDYFVGPKVGAELRRGAYWAIGFALAGILAYIWYRFQFQYGVGAVLALFHDVLITTGLMVLLGEEFTLTVVAALLTLAGYSVNDTIVVFDRIRENLRVMRNEPLETVIDRSVNQTLSRTVLTAFSTLLVVLTMLLFGGPEFHGFALALLIGITLGTYSSIFVASPLVVAWQGLFAKGRSRRVARAQQ